MTDSHYSEIDTAHHATKGEHGQNGGFEEAAIDDVGWARRKSGTAGSWSCGTRRFLKFSNQPLFINPMSPGKEPERFLWPEISTAAGKPVPIEDPPTRGIAAENRRKLHLARNQWSCHAPILRQPAQGGCDCSHALTALFLSLDCAVCSPSVIEVTLSQVTRAGDPRS